MYGEFFVGVSPIESQGITIKGSQSIITTNKAKWISELFLLQLCEEYVGVFFKGGFHRLRAQGSSNGALNH